MLEIRDGEDVWQWFGLEIRLNAFRQSTIPQKEFIINVSFTRTTTEGQILHMHEIHEQAFKEFLSSESCISYFESDKGIFIFNTDTSPYVIPAILLEKLRNQ